MEVGPTNGGCDFPKTSATFAQVFLDPRDQRDSHNQRPKQYERRAHAGFSESITRPLEIFPICFFDPRN
jgi:hypothetical protein